MMNMDVNQTSSGAVNDYSEEIETGTVSLLWHYPEWLASFLREHDPQLVFFCPHLRWVLEAIGLSYGELGLADWATVVQVVRELERYEDCGGHDGLNAVYSAKLPVAAELDRRCFKQYADLLARLAQARAHQVRLYRFVRGDFLLEPNQLKRGPGGPDYLGSGKFCGRTCRVLGYNASVGIRLAILPV